VLAAGAGGLAEIVQGEPNAALITERLEGGEALPGKRFGLRDAAFKDGDVAKVQEGHGDAALVPEFALDREALGKA
jgi:hypothetical protein